MGSSAYATKYYSLSRCLAKTTHPTQRSAPTPPRTPPRTPPPSEVDPSEDMRNDLSTPPTPSGRYTPSRYSSAARRAINLDSIKSNGDTYTSYSNGFTPSRFASSEYQPPTIPSSTDHCRGVRVNDFELIGITQEYQKPRYLKSSNDYFSSRLLTPEYQTSRNASEVTALDYQSRPSRITTPEYQTPSRYRSYRTPTPESQSSRNKLDFQSSRIKTPEYYTPENKNDEYQNEYEAQKGSTAFSRLTAAANLYNSRNVKNEYLKQQRIETPEPRQVKTEPRPVKAVEAIKIKIVESRPVKLVEPVVALKTIDMRPMKVARPEPVKKESCDRRSRGSSRHGDTQVHWPGRNITCTARELSKIITEPAGGNYVIPFDAFNEVYPGVYIGDMHTALCTKQLRELGVTHVLNAAQKDPRPGHQAPGYYVNTNSHYYSRVDIEYHGVPATDVMDFDLSQYFEESAAFIDNALANNGKVLVHCHQGISRSATLVLAFLMLRRGMSAQEAMRTVRAKREIIPNPSFLRQLCDLNDKMTSGRRRFQDMHY